MVFSPLVLHRGDNELCHQGNELLFALGFQRQARTVVLVAVQRQYKRTFQDATGCRVNVFSTTPLQAKERLFILTMPQPMGLYPITCSLVDSVTICLRRLLWPGRHWEISG